MVSLVLAPGRYTGGTVIANFAGTAKAFAGVEGELVGDTGRNGENGSVGLIA